jgi:protein JSN1
MISAGKHTAAYTSDGLAKPAGWVPSVTEQQMIMKELSVGSPDADTDVQALSGSAFFLFLCTCKI